MDKVQKIIETLHPDHEHILVLPELWTSGFDLQNCSSHVHADQEILNELSSQAIEKKIWIAGSYITQENSAYYNTFVLLSPAGERYNYQKVHLIRLMNEHHWFTPGGSYCAVQTDFAQIGLSICYDLRFPAMFQSLSHIGCNLMLVTAAWPHSRIEHWNKLLPARAIENQSFFVACNAVGSTHREIFGGNSAVINPLGEVLLQASQTEEGTHTLVIDIEDVSQLRSKIPLLREQKEDTNQDYPVHLAQGSGRTSNTEA